MLLFAFLVLNEFFFYLVENSGERERHTHTQNWDFGSLLLFPASASRFLGGGDKNRGVLRLYICVSFLLVLPSRVLKKKRQRNVGENLVFSVFLLRWSAGLYCERFWKVIVPNTHVSTRMLFKQKCTHRAESPRELPIKICFAPPGSPLLLWWCKWRPSCLPEVLPCCQA